MNEKTKTVIAVSSFITSCFVGGYLISDSKNRFSKAVDKEDKKNNDSEKHESDSAKKVTWKEFRKTSSYQSFTAGAEDAIAGFMLGEATIIIHRLIKSLKK